MQETNAPLTPAQLGISLAVPAGIDPQKVAERKKMLLDCQAFDGRTADGQMQAERVALDAEVQQSAHLARVAGISAGRHNRETRSGHGMTLAEAVAITGQQPDAQ